jgi:hypothetical protein
VLDKIAKLVNACEEIDHSFVPWKDFMESR